jgi:hypothetical protein
MIESQPKGTEPKISEDKWCNWQRALKQNCVKQGLGVHTI